MPSTENMLMLRGLACSFPEGNGRREVLRGIELDVRQGECVALLGRSGSGKSTLLSLIAGIDRPDAGEIHVNGTELTRLNERERTVFRRRHIGFVYQFYSLIPTLTVEENLLLPLELNGRTEPQDVESANRLLEDIGLNDRRSDFPDRLSGGEQQRVTIARALVHNPPLVLADEPTGTLDADTGRRVLDLFDRLLRARGKTLILVTHSKTVSETADRVLTLEDGRLVKESTGVVW